jgi:hypothetical protein
MTYSATLARLRKPSWVELTNQQGAWRTHPRYQGCVGHWLMAEHGGLTVYDLTGRPLSNGVLTNMDPATDWTLGSQGPRLDFDGSNDYVSLGNASTGDPLDLGQANDSFTLLCRFTPASSGSLRILVKRASGSNAWAYVWGLTSLRLDFQLWNATANPLLTGASTLSQNTRYSAAAVRDHANGLLRMYLNGLPDGTAANNAGNFAVATATEIARGNVSFTSHYQGTIEEVRIYNRALTPAEILSWHSEPYLEFVETRAVGLSIAGVPVTLAEWMAAVGSHQGSAEFLGVQYV